MSKVKKILERNTVIPILTLIFLLSAIFVPEFMTWRNIQNVINQNSIKGIMAIGMTFVIINSYFDMSVCTLVSLTAAFVCGLQNSMGLVPAVFIALATGIIVGLINGVLVAKVGINAFVATLAMMLGCRGISYTYSGEKSILAQNPAFAAFGSGKILGFTYTSLMFFAMVIIAHFILRYTRHGRDTYAVGGSSNAAYNAGINISRVTIINFIVCGFTGGLGGILFAAQAGSASPPLGWPDIHMMIIAAVVLGGTKLSGGFGNIWYTVGGVMILGIISNIMNLLNAPTYLTTLSTGVIMIGVLLLDKFLAGRKQKALLKASS